MAKSTLFLPELEVALMYWEDMNLLAETFFSLSILNDPIMDHYKGYVKPLIGSELDEEKYLARAIKDYKNLRKCVESKIEFDPLRFLPRVPKEERGVFDQVNVMRFGLQRTISAYPYFLGTWLQYKKVYALKSPDVIKRINPEKKNFLPFLPYGSFLIKFEQPLQFNIGNKVFLEYNVMMLTLDKKDDVIDVFLLRSDMKELLLNEDGRNILLKKGPKMLDKVDYKDEVLFMGTSLLVENGTILEKIVQVEDGGEIKNHPHVVNVETSDPEDASFVLHTFLRDKVNGFCKLISELSPKKIIWEEAEEISVSIYQKPDNYDWNIVPITEIRNIKKLGGEIRISNTHTGHEKSPHWRRGHFHSYWVDGKLVRKWLDQKLIREDKLETENLKGSATSLTDEE